MSQGYNVRPALEGLLVVNCETEQNDFVRGWRTLYAPDMGRKDMYDTSRHNFTGVLSTLSSN